MKKIECSILQDYAVVDVVRRIKRRELHRCLIPYSACDKEQSLQVKAVVEDIHATLVGKKFMEKKSASKCL